MSETRRALLDFNQRLEKLVERAKTASQPGKTNDFASIHPDLAQLKQDYDRELGIIEECDPDVRKFGAVLARAEHLIIHEDPATYY